MIAKVFHQFTVPGNPVPWRRALRRADGRSYTDPKRTAYKAKVMTRAAVAGVPKLKGPVALTIRAWWACPKSYERAREPFAGGPMTSPKDADNVAKGIMDALNGLAYKDDGQVVELHVYKRWAKQGESGRVIVRYWGVNE